MGLCKKSFVIDSNFARKIESFYKKMLFLYRPNLEKYLFGTLGELLLMESRMADLRRINTVKKNRCQIAWHPFCDYTVVFTPFTAACSSSSIGITKHF